MTVRTFLDGRVSLHCGDCREVMASLPDASVDSIVTDPPYALVSGNAKYDFAVTGAGNPRERRAPKGGFMGKTWDTGEAAFAVEFWSEAFRVLKPGGHLLAFSGTRTYHRLACAIEDAGFEIRDQIGWAYGCLDEQTVAVTPSGNVHHSALKAGDLVLTYDVDRGSYQWGAVEHVHRYRISDTVYRVSTDHGEQVVSRNHRCVVERGGVESFALAEEVARQRQASVPVLESLPELLKALPRVHEGTGDAETGLLDRLQSGADRGEGGRPTITVQSTSDGHVCGVRQGESDPTGVAAQGRDANVLAGMQRRLARGRVENARAQGARGMDAGIGSRLGGAVYGAVQSLVEGWRHIPAQARQLCERALCPVPAGVPGDVATGWLRHGTSLGGRAHHGALPDTSGVGAPHRPQAAQQLPEEPHAVRDEQRSQAVRAWPGHKTVVGRVTPEHYDGVIWCVTVRTGAFVAVRNGMAFPTGNSGFPKSLDVSKAIDKAAGAERKVTGVVDTRSTFDGHERASAAINVNWREAEGRSDLRDLSKKVLSEPATDAAHEWQGWGTALKPAWEPICVARKPLIGTVAENVLKHGTGALNIDGCRVGIDDDERCLIDSRSGSDDGKRNGIYSDGVGARPLGVTFKSHALGRFPANLIHDGSDEVMACFPSEAGASAPVRGTEASAASVGTITGERARVAGAFHSDTGSAARFFASFPMEDEQWQKDRHGRQSSRAPVNNVAQCLSLQSEAAVSALSDAVARSMPGVALSLASYRAPSTSVTESECAQIGTLVTEMIQSFAGRCSRGQPPERLSLSDSLASIAVTPRPTGIIAITISLLKSSGSADPVTFDITVMSSELGASDSPQRRLHYTSKAGADDRLGSRHPTVKPIDLMQYLVRLVTPKGGVCLDPFAGTGTTGEAAWREGMNAILIEREAEYQEDIARRMDLAVKPSKRAAVAKTKGKIDQTGDLPLFAGDGS